jgi:hypothetical protein
LNQNVRGLVTDIVRIFQFATASGTDQLPIAALETPGTPLKVAIPM